MGPPAQAYVLPMSPEQRGVAREGVGRARSRTPFPIGQYDAPGRRSSISDQGDDAGRIRDQAARATREMLVPTDEIDAENLTAQGLSALETRFADSRGVPLVLLQHDKACGGSAHPGGEDGGRRGVAAPAGSGRRAKRAGRTSREAGTPAP